MARSTSPLRADPLGLPRGPHAEVLAQGLEVIERLPAELYASVPGELAHNGAGSHFRHVHDYYRCFLRDVETGRIDYDRRVRDERFETESAYAAEQLRDTIQRLGELSAELTDREVEVRMDADPADPNPWSRSTVNRELRFLVSHTIHHYALIAMILKVQEFSCGDDFGVAPSTLQHWAAVSSAAAPSAAAPSAAASSAATR